MADASKIPTTIQLAGLSYDKVSHQLSATGDVGIAAGIFVALLIGGWALRRLSHWRGPSLTLDQAEFGIGDAKITFKPNIVDRQVAYSIWVEVSTRKIGLAIDLDHDVVAEVYDSWYAFFSITRDLLKTVPADRAKDPSTREIIQLSIDLLNVGLRPHLTEWQARFRGWYEYQIGLAENAGKSPQEIQTAFPKWEELKTDLLRVNQRLTNYRRDIRKVF